MTIAALLVLDGHADQRQNERWKVKIGARSSSHGPLEHALTVLNLSKEGVLFETDQILPVNSPLVVEMPGGVRKLCRTVWNSGRQQGAIFGEPLSDVEFEAVVAQDAALRLSPNSPGESPQEKGFASGLTHDSKCSDDETKYPRVVRLLIGAGVSAGLWSMIGSALWLVWS